MILLVSVALGGLVFIWWSQARRSRKVIAILQEQLADVPNVYFNKCEFHNTQKAETLRMPKMHPGYKVLLWFRFHKHRIASGRVVDMHAIGREYADKLSERVGGVWDAQVQHEVSDVIDYLSHGGRR